MIKKIIYGLVALIVLLVGVAFATKTSQIVTVDFFGIYTYENNLTYLLYAFFIVGVVLGWVVSIVSGISARHKMRKQLKTQKQEIQSLSTTS